MISPQLNIIQSSMKEAMMRNEVAKSLYSDHELRHLEDVRRAERLASKSTEVDEKDLEHASKQTAQDFEDISAQELNAASFAGRTTKADKDNDVHSLKRCLDRRLMLVTKVPLGQETCHWLLPMILHSEDGTSQSLRQTAERAISCLSDSLLDNLVFLGNCPSSVYSYRYPSKIRSTMDGKEGGRIFFFKAQVKNSKKFTGKEIKGQDYQWLTREEAANLMSTQGTKRYWNCLSNAFLFESMGEDIVHLVVSRVRKNLVKGREQKDQSIASISG